MRKLRFMTSRTRKLLATLLFPGFVWLLITVLEPLAANRWLGPVPARNLEDGFDAGALFYTDINLEELLTPAVEDAGRGLRETDRP